MKLKNLTHAVIAGSIAIGGAGTALADGHSKGFEISGNVALTSDYRFRGLSQTSEGPAIQGGFDIESGMGVYVGTWASNVGFGDGSMEIDYYVGYAGQINDDVSFDIGYIYYDYPQGSEDNQDFDEWYASASFGDLTVGGAYTSEFFGDMSSAAYGYVDYSFALEKLDLDTSMSIDVHVGYQTISDRPFNPEYDNYTDYSVGVSKDAFGLTWSLAAVGTNLTRTECERAEFDTTDCSLTSVFTVSKSL